MTEQQMTRKERRAQRSGTRTATASQPASAPTAHAAPLGDHRPRFDRDTVAQATITACFTDHTTGRLTLAPNRTRGWHPGSGTIIGTGYLRPDHQTGHWNPVPAAEIRRDLAATGERTGHRMLDCRVDAAEAAFDRLLALVPAALLPVVDPVAVCTPERPGLPPKNWPAGRDCDDVRAWIADQCYGTGGRWLIVLNGTVKAWTSATRTWEPRDGSDDWFNDKITTWRGSPLPSGTRNVAGYLAWPHSTAPADPAEVAAYDLARAIAEVAATQTAYREDLNQ